MSTDKAILDIQQAQALLAQALAELTTVTVSTPTVRVASGDNLQAAIDAAVSGTTILVDPRGSYAGITLRAKPGTLPITIQPDTTSLTSGTRVDPSFSSALIKLSSPDGSYVVRADQGASNYILRGFYPQPYGTGGSAFASFGLETATDPSTLPNNIVVDQWLITADPNTGGKRGVVANCKNFTVSNSYISGLFFGEDSQAIIGWNGSNTVQVLNNYLEASGENILFGGSDATNSGMMPQNIIVRGNYITKPLAWKQKTTNCTIKNGFELKCALNVLVENNVIENTWLGGQVGCLVLFTTRNQDGTAPFSQLANITFQNNVVRHGAGFVQILGKDDRNPSVPLSTLKILGNLAYDIDPVKYGNLAGNWGSGRIFQITSPLDSLEIGHNTVLYSDPNRSSTINSAVTIYGTPNATNINIHDNILPEGDYGIAGDGDPLGRPALDAHSTNTIFTNNLLIRGDSGRNIDYGPQPNTVTPTGGTTIDPTTLKCIAPSPSTDGKTVGADIDNLHSLITFTI